MEEKELFLKLRHGFGLSRASKQTLRTYCSLELFSQLISPSRRVSNCCHLLHSYCSPCPELHAKLAYPNARCMRNAPAKLCSFSDVVVLI